MSIFEGVLATPETLNLFSDRSVVEAMLRFEAALARAQAQAGRIPESAALSIVGSCKAELFDVSKIVRDSARAGSIAQPLLRSLRESVGLFNPQAVPFVHAESSAQELLDNAMTLLLREALRWIEADLVRAAQALLAHAEQHANAPMLRREGALRPALGSFGAQCADWAAPLVRSLERLRAAGRDALHLQLARAPANVGGADGVRPLLAELLGFASADPIEEGAMDHGAALACELGLMVGHLGRIASGIAAMSRPEIAELAESEAPAAGAEDSGLPAEEQGSACTIALAAAQRVPQRVALLLAAMPQAGAPAAGGWQAAQAEWPQLLKAAHGSARAMANALPLLRIDVRRMRQHVDRQRAELPRDSSRGEVREAFDPVLAEAAGVAALSQVLALRGRLDLPGNR